MTRQDPSTGGGFTVFTWLAAAAWRLRPPCPRLRWRYSVQQHPLSCVIAQINIKPKIITHLKGSSGFKLPTKAEPPTVNTVPTIKRCSKCMFTSWPVDKLDPPAPLFLLGCRVSRFWSRWRGEYGEVLKQRFSRETFQMDSMRHGSWIYGDDHGCTQTYIFNNTYLFQSENHFVQMNF